MFMFSQNSHIETLAPTVMVFGDVAFGQLVFYFHYLREGISQQNMEPILTGLCFKNPDVNGEGT